jgi:hypothetical protein
MADTGHARWRRAAQWHECESLGYAGLQPCEASIEPGSWYLDIAVAQPVKHHVRYCAACAERKGFAPEVSLEKRAAVS